MSINDVQGGANTDNIMNAALDISNQGTSDISRLLNDIEGDSKINNVGVTGSTAAHDGLTVMNENNYTTSSATSVDITTATGAMVIDDLMQKLSTKVQVAAQMLSSANNMAKTASRILSQG